MKDERRLYNMISSIKLLIPESLLEEINDVYIIIPKKNGI